MRSRQELIHSLILRHGELRAEEVCEALLISPATVRRDFAALERRGLIERTWGGAAVRNAVNYLGDFLEAANLERNAKRAIAAYAADLVKPGMVIGLSGGTTCTELARWLRGSPITVVTNSVNVAAELYNLSHTKVILTGGALNNYSYELVGEMVVTSLSDYRLDVCFLGCSGLTPDFGFSMWDHPEAAVARAFLAASERAHVVSDHTKIGRRTFARFATISDIDLLITDEGADKESLATLEAAGLATEVAPYIVTGADTK
jgi:DeoR family transcriptional regulator of aga operon